MAFQRIIDLVEKGITPDDKLVYSTPNGVLHKTRADDLPVDLFNYTFNTGHEDFATGLTNDEIHRVDLQSNQSLEIQRLEFQQKGGGSSSNASVRIQDLDVPSTLAEQDLGGVTRSPGTSQEASTLAVEVSNSTGSTVTGTVILVGTIKNLG